MTAPRLVVASARKYEPDWLVDQLHENVAWADAIVTLDQRHRVDELWSDRAERVAELRRLAIEAGGDWCLIIDPDERLEDHAEDPIRRAIAGRPTTSYSLRLREMFTPTAYRVDGIWDGRNRRRLFHLHAKRKRRQVLDVNLYHLKMIEPANRAMRATVHTQANTWDNRALGFEYLADDTGMTLVEIPVGRGYSPPYRPYRFEVPADLLAPNPATPEEPAS